MNCFNCGAIAQNEDIYCHNCGTKLKQSVCKKCGNTLEENDKYCYKCGTKVDMITGISIIKKVNSNLKIQENIHKHKKILVVSISVVLVLVILCAFVSCFISNSPSKKILGEWSTERGLDSSYLTFKGNGTLIERPDIFTSREYDYYVRGNILYVENTYNSSEYYYSKDAMYDDADCWYIDEDVLYYKNRTYYRQ